LTQKPVLVVAESAVLTENSREDLYRSLRQSNCRAVILYVRKTIASKKGGVGLVVADPMSSGECELFEKSYSSLVIDEAIKLKLRQVSTNDDFDRYRIPFFFGLIAFEREFETVDRFVNSYLQRVRGRAREAIELLAFVTLFSDHGFSKALVAKIAGLSSTTDASIEILLGEGAARLLIEREAGFRIMHQRIAEEVLNWAYSTARDGWQRHLQQLAIQFIEMVCREAGNNSEFTLATLREIFIDRIGGDVDDVKDRQKFAPVIELLDNLVGPAHGHQIFLKLTEECPEHAHFWMHRGRHHIYRLRGDATVAEGYLERAVSLSPLDPIMHHAYGLVLRYRIREMIRTSRDMDARELLDSILPHYRKASDEFRIARELDPENMHGYVTHIQLNINVCGAIKKLVAIQSVAQIRFTPYQDLAEFVEQAMVEAQTLLRDVSGLYGTLTASQSRYVVTCSKSIRVLYNDYDEAIRLLERADAALGGAYIRRSLANAYLSRRQRHWSELSTAEIRRVTNLMKKNLDAPGRQDDDYRLWFEGYRLLPEFDPVTALDRLSVWSVESASWRPYYYLFVLNFMRWLNHEIISLDEMDAAVAKSKERLIGRRTISDFWLGKRGSRWVLIHESELGEWDKDNKDRYKRFWKDPSRLHRKNGQIDRRIDGPQAANIWIEGRAKAFFVPGKSFSANRDENKLVNFYLGFNPEGLRAWSVEHGHVHGGNRTEEVIPTVADAAFEHDQLPEADKLDRARVLQKARVLSFVQDIIVSAASEDVRLELNDISMRVDACFGIPDIYKVIGFSDKGDLVSGNPKFYVESSEVGTLVGLNPSQEEDAAGLSLQQCLPGYIDQVYDAVQTARIRALDNRMYVALFDVFQAEQRDSIQSMVPVEIALVSRKGRTSVTGVKIVEDRIYVSDRGLLDVGELTNALCDRFRKFSAAQFSEPQFLRGIVPLERCYQLLGVSKFGELLAKVGAEVRREAKLEVAAQRKAQSEARARRNAQAEAEALGADVTRMSSSVREGRGGKQVATAVAEAVGVRKHGKVKRFVKNRQSTIETELYRTIGDVIDKFNQGKGISLPRLGQDLIDADPQWKEKLKKLNRSKLRPFVEKNGQFEIFEEGSTAYVRRRPGATE
jgi:tetratricopeptide (TPR) repeat protein